MTRLRQAYRLAQGRVPRPGGGRFGAAAVVVAVVALLGALLPLGAAAATVNAAITVTPGTVSQETNVPQTMTAHVTVDSGSGLVAAPDGTAVTFSLSNQHGGGGVFVGASSCTTSGGSCSVQVESHDEGQTVVSASTTAGGLTRTTGDGVSSDGPTALITWVDAFVTITPETATNSVGTAHTFTGQVMVNQGLGAGYVPGPGGLTLTWGLQNSNGASAAFVGGGTCTTAAGTGSCDVQIDSLTAGQTDISAATTVQVGGITLPRRTSGGLPSDGVDATKTWVDASIAVTPQQATDPAGDTHTLTATVQVNNGSGAGWTTAPAGTPVTFSLTNAGGATATFVGSASCTTTGTTGQCTAQISSPTAGTTTVNASTTLTVSGISLTRATGGVMGPKGTGPATKTWVAPGSSLAKDERDLGPQGSATGGAYTSTIAAASPADIIEYRLTFTNTGGAAATNVTVDDTVPAHTTFVSCSGGCTNAGTAPGSALHWSLGTVAAGASSAVTFEVRLDATFPTGSTTITNVATTSVNGRGGGQSGTVSAVVTVAASGVSAATSSSSPSTATGSGAAAVSTPNTGGGIAFLVGALTALVGLGLTLTSRRVRARRRR